MIPQTNFTVMCSVYSQLFQILHYTYIGIYLDQYITAGCFLSALIMYNGQVQVNHKKPQKYGKVWIR